MSDSQLALAFKDDELKRVAPPPLGVEYVRFPSPPPSVHSSDEDDEMTTGEQKRRKKLRKTRAEYVELRNKTFTDYLKKMKDNPPRNFGECIARFRKQMEKKMRNLKGKNYVAKWAVPKVEDEDVCYSDTSKDTECSFPGNTARVLRQEFQKKCCKMEAEHRKQILLLGSPQINGALEGRVIFSHLNFRMILEAKWKLMEMKRLEEIMEGNLQNERIDSDTNGMNAGNEIQKIYGPMDTGSEHFKNLVKALEVQYIEFVTEMLEKENKMIGRIQEQNLGAANFSEALASLREARSKLETWMASLPEGKCDQNPYTNRDNMDFWVMPRPKETIKIYDVRKKEMEDFLEFNLPLDEKGRPKLEEKDKYKLFVREGYSCTVFDVGWHFSPEKIYGDIPWKVFFIDHTGVSSRKSRKNFTEERWRKHLLELRGELMSFNPFGVELTHLFKDFRTKNGIQNEESIFGNLFDQNGVYCLSDMFFAQTLSTGANPKNKTILFDSLLEGVIVTPVEMLRRVWERIRFLIEERPNHLLPLKTLPNIYEVCFRQKLFPLQWGFKDVEDFLLSAKQHLPKEVTQDVTIVRKDDKELLKMETKASGKSKEKETRKEIEAKWAKILENDVDEEEDDELLAQFDLEDLYAELIHEGPWLSEGDVYRVLDD